MEKYESENAVLEGSTNESRIVYKSNSFQVKLFNKIYPLKFILEK